jgi:hypothetical protein
MLMVCEGYILMHAGVAHLIEVIEVKHDVAAVVIKGTHVLPANINSMFTKVAMLTGAGLANNVNPDLHPWICSNSDSESDSELITLCRNNFPVLV